MSDPSRPSLHFTAERHWINDPNGLIHHRGLWHLFYQHNPRGPHWGHMHWGHAVSRDLARWESWPLALGETPEGWMAFSGGVVALDAARPVPGGDRLMAFFTAHHPDLATDERVCRATSLDGGRTFASEAPAPVLAPEPGTRKFGDPKVWWDRARERWAMLNIAGWPDQGRAVFAVSRDLIGWEVVSEFRAPDLAPGVWECPDLVRLPVEGEAGREIDLLKVNTWDVAGGSRATVIFRGRFDGGTFQPDPEEPRIASPTPPGDPAYAEVSWADAPDGRSVWAAWLRQEPNPAARGWTGAHWLPRELSVESRGGILRLVQRPARELFPAGAARGAFLAGKPFGRCVMRLAMPEGDWSLRFPDSLGGGAALHREGSSLRLERSGGKPGAPVDAPEAGPIEIWIDGPCLAVFAGGGSFAANEILHEGFFLGAALPEAGKTLPAGDVGVLDAPGERG